ncbi:30S ribosomal protein S3 [candidate division WS5 bacterium]|uniref:Small ribosomal subunit protein uS3 n=1 Tax=candidate division WS5 bacterium TaxID=2093353 RepID=A0A419DAC3_9BACT|nr:MAG: 30S ribosomal protein S3 [candidate division WS5 bacterium]
MGHKVSPISFRLQVSKDWASKWYSDKEYAKYLHEDIKLRKYIMNNLGRKAGVAKTEIERNANQVSVNIHTSRPGVLIGRGGAGAIELKKNLQKLIKSQLKDINIEEVRTPEVNPKLIADTIASQLERRMAYKRTVKQAVDKALKGGAKGVKVMVSGRLNGAEIARREFTSEGKIPLQTIRADIAYGTSRANTTYGVIGIKVWIYMGGVTKNRTGEK